MTITTLGDRVYIARLARGYTRRQLARLAEVHEDTILNYETNQTTKPQEAVAIRIARVLRVNAAWLILGHGSMDGTELE